MAITIARGSALNIPFRIRWAGHDEFVPPERVAFMEVYVGPYRKTYPDGGILLEDDYFLFPLTQQDTFRISSNLIEMVGRIKTTSSEDIAKIHFTAVKVESYPGREII